jgi:hypothetical protein
MCCTWKTNPKRISRSTCHNQHAKEKDGYERTCLRIEFDGEPVGDGRGRGAGIRKGSLSKVSEPVGTEEYFQK